MADELAVKVRVKLDTDTKKLDAQLESVKSHYAKNPIKLAFTVDQQALRNNITQALGGVDTKKLLPKITLDAAIDANKLNQQIKSALGSVDIGSGGVPSGSSAQIKAYSDQLSQLYSKMKALGEAQRKLEGLQVGTGNTKQIDAITASIQKLEAQIAKLKSDLAGQGVDVTQLREFKSLTEELADKLNIAKAAAEDMRGAMEAQGSSYSNQAAELERLKGKVDAYREAAQQLYSQGVSADDYGFEFKSEELEKDLAVLDKAEDKLKRYQQAVKDLNQELGLMTKSVTAQNRALNETTQLDKLYTQIERFVSSNPNLGKNSDLMAQIESLQNAASSHTIGLKDATAQWANLQKSAFQYGLVGETSLQKIGRLFKEHFNTSLIMIGVHALQQSLQGIYQNVLEVDTAMTELKKVTEETSSTYDKFLDNATTRAKTFGASVADIVNATADAARLGLNLEDASALADASVVYKNVGDGITSIGDASSSVISTMKAFNIEAQNSMGIVDEFNEVGNKFAISSAGVGDALLRSASALAAGGNSLEESIGLITAANDVVQNPDSVGTAMKTVSMYLRATKTELEEAGESTEGMAATISELRSELLALTHEKVDIQLDADTYKSTYQILKEMSAAWKDMTDMERAAATKLMGGKRNANVISALMTNFETAEKAVQVAGNATGSAIAENEKYLDSIQGKLSQFEAAFQSFSTHVLDSGLVKGLIDIGTGFMTAADAAAEFGAALPLITAALAGLLSTTKAKDGKQDMPAYAGCELVAA